MEKTDWLKLLQNTEVFTSDSLVVMKCLCDFGGVASCTELKNKYGRQAQYYNGVSIALAKRVYKATNCTVMIRSDGSKRWWPVLYLGKNADKKQPGTYAWKLRKELEEALKDFDLSSVELCATEAEFATDDETERRENAQDIDISGRETNEKHFWIYTPGPAAYKWDEFYSQSIIGIGWDELGDLAQYPDREAMRTKMKELYGEAGSYKNNSLAAWQFARTIHEGDIVFAKKGVSEIIGRGVVESGYKFMQDRDEYKNVRKIKWTHSGSWPHPGQSTPKTLTDITPYTDYVQNLELLIAGDSAVEEFEPEEEIKYKVYSDANYLNEVFMEPEQYEMLVALLKAKKNVILQGAPGVGKTFAAKRLAYSMIGSKDTSRVTMVQFHQSYSYEDFIMGYHPAKDGFELTTGPFYKFCKDAQDDLERDYFFIIDEINRGNLSKIFGELLMLIENDKRGEKLRLLYANELFSVPQNVHTHRVDEYR